MPENKLQLKLATKETLSTSVAAFKETKDPAALAEAVTNGVEFAKAIGAYGQANKTVPRNTHFSFDISLARYLVIEDIFMRGKIRGGLDPVEDVVVDPEWTMSGTLGAFNYDDEVLVNLSFSDPSNIVSDITLSGSLPAGVALNKAARAIYGYVEDEASASYSFTITLHTSTGKTFPLSFTMNTVVSTSSIEWETDGDLGAYSAGSVINQNLEAGAFEEY